MSPFFAHAHRTASPSVLPAAHQAGSFVRITEGPLAGLTGRLLDAPESGRYLIEVPSLGEGAFLRCAPELLESVWE